MLAENFSLFPPPRPRSSAAHLFEEGDPDDLLHDPLHPRNPSSIAPINDLWSEVDNGGEGAHGVNDVGSDQIAIGERGERGRVFVRRVTGVEVEGRCEEGHGEQSE